MIKIPLVPQWNLNSGCVCTPDDGGFLYVGSRSINFISSIKDDTETPTIRCFHTRQSILSLDIDPCWGRNENNSAGGVVENVDKKENIGAVASSSSAEADVSSKLFVALQQDNSIQIWDFNKGCAIQGHKAHVLYMGHMEGNGPSPQHGVTVLISYMCNRNVLSIDNQDIVVYCVASNSYYRRPMFISQRNHHLSSMKCSPYNENQFAVGTTRGLVLLCDLQKMAILYTLRGHDSGSITSLAWNRFDLTPAPEAIAVEQTKPAESNPSEVIPKKSSKPAKLTRASRTLDTDDIFDIYDYDYLDNEFGAPTEGAKQKNEMSDFVGIEKPKESSTTAKFDFAEACQSLKEEINALRDEQQQMSPDHMVSLEECQRAASSRDDLSSCGSDKGGNKADETEKPCSDKESSDGSIVQLLCRTPSSEESVDVDGMDRNKQQNIICQAEIHNSQSQDIEDAKSVEALQTEINNEDDCKIVEVVGEVKPIDAKDNYDTLLATASSDGSICIWNTATGATCDSHKIRGSQGGKNTLIVICWTSTTSFIVNNKAGDLQLWTMQTSLPSDKTGTPNAFKLYKYKECKRRWSQRAVVSFIASPTHQLLWSISSHREISLDDLKLNKIKLQYSCVSSNICSMQECPDDMNKIALGFSDRRIGIIDISKITPTSVRIENFVHRIESTVMSLVWSPDCKKIAYGTVEGRVGILNVEGSTKTPYTFNSMCGNPIYSMCWQDKYLYVVGNDRIAVYEDDINKKDPYVIPDIVDVSSISLRNNYLFVGTQKGHIQMYARVEYSYCQYKLKKTLELSPRYITKMAWSPIATHKLAVVSMANNIHILEFNPETEDLQIIRKFEVHAQKAANSCVKWSNRNENYFLTCGYEGGIRVWDLSSEKQCEHFVKTYHCPMTCGLFLPTDEEVIICSGKSAALEFIDMRLEKTENSSLVKSKRPQFRTLDNILWATKALTRNEGKSMGNDKKSNRRIVKTPENNIDAIESLVTATSAINIGGGGAEGSIENNVTNTVEVSAMLDKLHLQKPEDTLNNSSIYMKNPSTLLYLTTKELNKDATELMFKILSSATKHEKKSLCAKLYGTKAEAKEVLAEELKNQQHSDTKGISSIFMPQLTANLKDEILKCVQTKQLCEWHVSLAPTISYNFWQKCCQAYAEQLVEQGYALQAASYMLAIHQQQGAITMLLEKKYFKEALLISRIYLQPEDPLNKTISEQWITHLYNQGNLTGAALLCLLTNQNNRAYECLAKIRNTAPEIERVIRLLKSSDIQS